VGVRIPDPNFSVNHVNSTKDRECCLLVLNLVSSTLPCIRQPRPRLLWCCWCCAHADNQ